MKKITLFLFFCLSIFHSGSGFSQNSISASQVLEKVVNAITSGKGVEADFTVNNSGYSGRGSIKSSGTKFNVKMPDVEVWYNGKDMYTYNAGSGETTIVYPSDEELAETNPLEYVTNAQKKYNVTFSTVKKEGKYVLELIPKSKGEVKRITLTIRKSDFKPDKIVVEPSSGNPISADISSFKNGVTLANSIFEYPKSKYPNVEIVDLR